MALNTLFYLIAGLAGLWLGTDLLIRGALEISDRLKLSRVFVGLTILAVGTDLPELLISIMSSINRLKGVETSDLIMGNVIGSCFGQIILTVGVIGLISYFTLSRKQLIREGMVLIGATMLLFLVTLDGKLTRLEGISFIIIYILYFLSVHREQPKKSTDIQKAPPIKLAWSIISLIAGLVILVASSETVVDNAVTLAQSWGVSQFIIAVILIGAGTSLPELVVSIGAALKKAPGLSIGNLIGSNIFDLLLVTGAGASIATINIPKHFLYFDLPFLAISSLILLSFFIMKKGIQKHEAISLIIIYATYITFKLIGY